jgi:hypothetical protein
MGSFCPGILGQGATGRCATGLRRALGATRGHIRIQFLSGAVLLAGPEMAAASARPSGHAPPTNGVP